GMAAVRPGSWRSRSPGAAPAAGRGADPGASALRHHHPPVAFARRADAACAVHPARLDGAARAGGRGGVAVKAQRGVALITVLLVVAIVTVVSAGMIARQQLSIRTTANQLQARQAWHY